jgi:hypothetical protein
MRGTLRDNGARQRRLVPATTKVARITFGREERKKKRKRRRKKSATV